MKPKKVFIVVSAALKAKVFKKRLPLIVGWAITNRCNRRCPYCAIWKRQEHELSTTEALALIDRLWRLKTKIVSFTGGEPLLRDDIGKIIDYLHQKGIETKINSSGTLVKEKIKDLKNLDNLTLSLEGPRDIHDAIRGSGSFEEVMQAAKVARENGIKVNFATVLTSTSLGAVDFVLDKAGEFGAQVIFQPATQIVLGGSVFNPLAPPLEEYRMAIEKLIKKKKEGGPAIGNSISGLKHLWHWPHPKPMKCASGFVSCRIEPNGDVLHCSREKQPGNYLNCLSQGFEEAFKNLAPIVCGECWCAGRVELNLSFNTDLASAFQQMKVLWKKK